MRRKISNLVDPRSVGKNGRDAFKKGVVSKWADGRNFVKNSSGVWEQTNKGITARGTSGNPSRTQGNNVAGSGGGNPVIRTKIILRVVK